MIGKSRLAPLKQKRLSIPKLEIQAATIAVRIKVKLLSETNFNVKNISFWSDSKAVLKYIYNENKHFPVYVMHRLDEIRSNSSINDWNYIPTNLNISDVCTRPIDFTDLINKRDSYYRKILQRILVKKKYTMISNVIYQLSMLMR